ncbi:MAG: pyruvate kinase [Lachnospiraceae bacterium]|nr:pyruvate kinase [Lachnospiraceae bacterium]
MRKTKIICTMGPAVDDPEVMKSLIQNGMNVARFNFSHGSHAEQRERFQQLKRLREELGVPVAALLDTKGPEIRTGVLKDGQKVKLEQGQAFTLTTRSVVGDASCVQINYDGLNEDVEPGNQILIDDGLIGLEVVSVDGPDIHCTVSNGGELGERKGVNVPNVKINLPPITEKDRDDIIFGIEQGFDFIAASFVRNVDAVLEIREILQEYGANDIKIISKIENREGVENIDSIIKASDGVMVARGDLGVEIPAEEVPYIQKTIIKKCNDQFKTVITATQMLDSMMRNPRPTRAEVADVANAVYDGTDCVMLSGETAAGKYPLDALNMMCRICENAESHLDYEKIISERRKYRRRGISTAVVYAAAATGLHMNARYIVTPTLSGFTARMMAKFRPHCPILALSPSDSNLRKMQILWGVTPMHSEMLHGDGAAVIDSAYEIIQESGRIEPGDTVIITAGVVSKNEHVIKGVTNTMQVLTAR